MEQEHLKRTLDKLTNKLIQPNHDSLIEKIEITDITERKRRLTSGSFYSISIIVVFKLDKVEKKHSSDRFGTAIDICNEISDAISYIITEDFLINVEFYDKNYVLWFLNTFFKNKTGKVYYQ